MSQGEKEGLRAVGHPRGLASWGCHARATAVQETSPALSGGRGFLTLKVDSHVALVGVHVQGQPLWACT